MQPGTFNLESVARGEAIRLAASERRALALKLHDRGFSYKEVGLKLGVRGTRAGQLIRRGRKERAYREIHGSRDVC
jgi:DNA-directed RNA polymerase specialized sigma24 family protein